MAALPHRPRRVLDLACGTGAAAFVFAAAGLRTVGVDRSPQMLAFAHARARAAGFAVTLIEADLRALPSSPPAGPLLHQAALEPASFELITCLYDSLNYLTVDHELAQVLTSASYLLKPGGHLFFDLNTEHEFKTWTESDQVVYDDQGILVYNRLNYDPDRRLATGHIGWFVRDDTGRWWPGSETHTERAWSDNDVEAALAAAGLTLVTRRTPRWELAPADAPRIVYHACKR
nr:class I SAM-dependent methyltransferase [Candidatus Chloroploca mongolica]